MAGEVTDVRIEIPTGLQPPRRTGNTDIDLRQLSDYVQKLYESLQGIKIVVDRKDEGEA